MDSIKWRRLSVDDRELYERYYNQSHTQITDMTFHCRFAWDNIFESYIAEVDGCLLQISCGGTYTKPFALMPLGEINPEKLASFAILLRDAFTERGWSYCLRGIDEDLLPFTEKITLPHMAPTFDRDSSDYLYRADDLRLLEGKTYQKKRNHIRKFEKNYPEFTYQTVTDAIAEDCLALVASWSEAKGVSINDTDHSDYRMIERLFTNWGALRIRGGAIRNKPGGPIIAFSLGSFAKDTGFIHFEKADANYDGLYAVINWETIKHEFPDAQWINREEDMGIPGLRKSKLSYAPAKLLSKYKICF